jgi:peptidoglycan LD-endopeptidase LytH
MSKGRPRRSLRLFALFAAFVAGALVDMLLRTYGPPMPAGGPHLAAAAPASGGAPAGSVRAANPSNLSNSSNRSTPSIESADSPAVVKPIKPPAAPPVAVGGVVSAPPLRVPIDGVAVDTFKGGFGEHRGSRLHEAVDILAPRGTPVHAVQNGRIAKLFLSKAGGITIYEFDPEERLCFYYAHLDHYADGLHEGQTIAQGDVIGFVGTSGNAPPNTPHLHFAVFELNADHHWWQGRPVDPNDVFSR